jgi:hypothetical protein
MPTLTAQARAKEEPQVPRQVSEQLAQMELLLSVTELAVQHPAKHLTGYISLQQMAHWKAPTQAMVPVAAGVLIVSTTFHLHARITP